MNQKKIKELYIIYNYDSIFYIKMSEFNNHNNLYYEEDDDFLKGDATFCSSGAKKVDENIRAPDEIIQERLIDNEFNYDNQDNQDNDDINIAIQKSLEEFIQQNNHLDENDLEYEKIIHQSIIDESERIEKEKKIYEEYNKSYILQKENKYKYFISKLTYIIGNIDKRNMIISIIKRYIDLHCDEKYLFLCNHEYMIFKKFINYIYYIPLQQNRKIPLPKDDIEELLYSIQSLSSQEKEESSQNEIKDIDIKNINHFFN